MDKEKETSRELSRCGDPLVEVCIGCVMSDFCYQWDTVHMNRPRDWSCMYDRVNSPEGNRDIAVANGSRKTQHGRQMEELIDLTIPCI